MSKREGVVAEAEASLQAREDQAIARLDKQKTKMEQDAAAKVKDAHDAFAQELHDKLKHQEGCHVEKQTALNTENARLRENLSESDARLRTTVKARLDLQGELESLQAGAP